MQSLNGSLPDQMWVLHYIYWVNVEAATHTHQRTLHAAWKPCVKANNCLFWSHSNEMPLISVWLPPIFCFAACILAYGFRNCIWLLCSISLSLPHMPMPLYAMHDTFFSHNTRMCDMFHACVWMFAPPGRGFCVPFEEYTVYAACDAIFFLHRV